MFTSIAEKIEGAKLKKDTQNQRLDGRNDTNGNKKSKCEC